ncbi:hypothetical protein ACSBR2_024712 [Camellia fascicularis]
MANDGQKEKVGDDIPTGSETRDPNLGEKDIGKEGDVPKKSNRSRYYNEDDLQVWKDRCLRRDEEMKGMVDKLANLQMVVNFMKQNNVMQLPFPLQDTPILTAKNNTQKGGKKIVRVAP